MSIGHKLTNHHLQIQKVETATVKDGDAVASIFTASSSKVQEAPKQLTQEELHAACAR